MAESPIIKYFPFDRMSSLISYHDISMTEEWYNSWCSGKTLSDLIDWNEMEKALMENLEEELQDQSK